MEAEILAEVAQLAGAGDGLQNYAFPRPGTDGGPGSGPETDTTGSKNLLDNDGLQMIYYPGIFPPYWEPGTDGEEVNPWSSANTFIQAFGVRRGWLLDLDYEDQKPGTYMVYSQANSHFSSSRPIKP